MMFWIKLLSCKKCPLPLFMSCVLALWFVKVANNETLRVEACPGSPASLPCPALAPIQDNDRALAAFWYKDDQVSPFYMVDGRTAPSIDQGKHRRLSILGNRSRFDVVSSLLHLDVEGKGDAGVYVCRVDSYRSLTRTSTVELHVKVWKSVSNTIRQPDFDECDIDLLNNRKTKKLSVLKLAPTPKLRIYQGALLLPDVAGPYAEGSDLELTCEMTGLESSGPLQVLWMTKGRVVDSTFRVLPSGAIRNDFLLRSLHRGQWMEPLLCVAAANPNASGQPPALSASLQIDLYLRPLGVRINPGDGSCREGSPLELLCHAWGSRPAADISWWRGNSRLPPANSTSSTTQHSRASSSSRHDASSSSSVLRLVPMAADHGQVVTCRAENPKLPGVVMTDAVQLNVTFPPQVSLSLKTYSSGPLSEGDTVALTCHVSANPPVARVSWSFDPEAQGRNAFLPPGDSGAPTLVLERVTPGHKGSYRCGARNAAGAARSGPLWLAVRHRPVCRAGQRVSYAAAQWGEPLLVRCEVEAEPGDVSFQWGFFSSSAGQHGAVNFASRGLRSVATYTPTEEGHLGSLLCWANNSAGEQHVPCTFTVFRPVPPNRPKNCRVHNRTSSSFSVACEAGYDGGAEQRFHFSAALTGGGGGGGVLSLSAPSPTFSVAGLPDGAGFRVSVHAENKVGRSEEVRMDTTTAARGKRKGPPSAWKATRSLVVSSLLILCFAVFTLTAAFVLRRRSRPFLL